MGGRSPPGRAMRPAAVGPAAAPGAGCCRCARTLRCCTWRCGSTAARSLCAACRGGPQLEPRAKPQSAAICADRPRPRPQLPLAESKEAIDDVTRDRARRDARHRRATHRTRRRRARQHRARHRRGRQHRARHRRARHRMRHRARRRVGIGREMQVRSKAGGTTAAATAPRAQAAGASSRADRAPARGTDRCTRRGTRPGPLVQRPNSLGGSRLGLG